MSAAAFFSILGNFLRYFLTEYGISAIKFAIIALIINKRCSSKIASSRIVPTSHSSSSVRIKNFERLDYPGWLNDPSPVNTTIPQFTGIQIIASISMIGYQAPIPLAPYGFILR